MPQCYQSIVAEASIEKVWDTIQDFHDMSWAGQVIDSCMKKGELSGNEVGAQRILNGAFYETLLECNKREYRIRYSIDDGPSPVSAKEVSHYVGQILLKPVTINKGTFIEWSSSWESNTDYARDFCHQIYIALLKILAEKI